MTFPIEFGYGSYKVSAHLIFELLAFFTAFRFYIFLRKKTKDPISKANRFLIIIGATLGAFLGSRLVGGLEDPNALANSKHLFLYFFATKTIVGGLLGGLFSVELVKLLIHEKKNSGDIFVFPIILGMSIGRIGCFSNGIYEMTYGVETHFFLGMDLGDGLHRHPVALYEIIFLLVLASILYGISKKIRLRNGLLFKLFMIAYLVFRFLLEYIKPVFFWDSGLSTIQIACIIGLTYYFFVFLIKRKPVVDQ
ncbi:prolipoprotein diacylglyceryl transferase [Parvicella tangerina]|uniref:Phosphatidylglycerol--prolipoprotein diacylglyceryl transferase n=1 Tax=Parvicella tangerina TaxID=2829795 RepID=A0A916JKE5_9FLAO|nr:prolipoprotein diacylglyceryl transferase [Parvicella tangerina]CAG5076806.1 Phosphatidylglycerol--prolipoprotein diacylglyceryl transferase [Parvicella tangerina]